MKKILVAIVLIAGSLTPIQSAQSAEFPTVVFFDFSPREIELTAPQTTVTFELVVQHPNGIKNSSTILTASGPRNNSITGYLYRLNQIGIYDGKPVTFRGTLTFPRTVAEGPYSIKTEGVSNFNSTGYQYSTGDITPTNFRTLVGAESALLLRLQGDANIVYNMFTGPTYDTLTSLDFKNISKYNRQKVPILKVGESYDPNDYFESYVPEMPLKVTSSTPSICSTDGSTLKFIATGNCQFKVFTDKTKDYAAQSSGQNLTITTARPKSTFYVGEIASQLAKDLPKTLTLPQVYSAAAGYVLPLSTTPSVCIASAYTVRLISGGTCILTYQTQATDDYLASDLYKQVIEIARDPQTISFTPPATINISSKSIKLAATVSSAGPITFESKNPENCSISGDNLSLLKSGKCEVIASQAGTSLIAPVAASQTIEIMSAKRAKIICVKKNQRIVTFKKKCPKGFRKLAP